MKTTFTALYSLTLAVSLSACASAPTEPQGVVNTEVPHQQNAMDLTVVTWNAEHLSADLKAGCKPRTESQLSDMKAYVKSLDADIVGLQEVGSKQALGAVFPESQWQLVMSSRPDSDSYECRGSGNRSTQQKVAFAVKKGLKIEKTEHLSELGLNLPGLRYGLGITVNTELGELNLLNVHMKSGCFVDDYQKSDSSACQTFSQQAPILKAWVDQQRKSGSPYIVLGDFNHRLSAPYNRLTRELTQPSPQLAGAPDITTANLISCHPRYPAPIDHLLAGNLSRADIKLTPKVHLFEDMEESAMLSDHCAMSLSIKQQSLDLMPSVTWHTESKEYQILTQAIYANAGLKLMSMEPQISNWVVVMDVDETILDNSGYQVVLNQTGQSYSRNSWNEWVKSKQAVFVPGAEQFIRTVFSLGGKVAMITNREKQLDSFTWENLTALGLPITPLNTCLTGRSDQDTESMSQNDIINDKDLRREQLVTGKADCFLPSSQQSSWQGPHQIIMQIGDNIEDVKGVTQEGASPQALLNRVGKDIILLPNSMYGSW